MPAPCSHRRPRQVWAGALCRAAAAWSSCPASTLPASAPCLRGQRSCRSPPKPLSAPGSCVISWGAAPCHLDPAPKGGYTHTPTHTPNVSPLAGCCRVAAQGAKAAPRLQRLQGPGARSRCCCQGQTQRAGQRLPGDGAAPRLQDTGGRQSPMPHKAGGEKSP